MKKYFVFSDVHGCFDTLKEGLNKMNYVFVLLTRLSPVSKKKKSKKTTLPHLSSFLLLILIMNYLFMFFQFANQIGTLE